MHWALEKQLVKCRAGQTPNSYLNYVKIVPDSGYLDFINLKDLPPSLFIFSVLSVVACHLAR